MQIWSGYQCKPATIAAREGRVKYELLVDYVRLRRGICVSGNGWDLS